MSINNLKSLVEAGWSMRTGEWTGSEESTERKEEEGEWEGQKRIIDGLKFLTALFL